MAKRKPDPEPSAEASCAVLSPLKYNGVKYGAGEPAILPQVLIDELTPAGVVGPPEPEAEPTTNKD